jgi:hypothetical protein
MMTVIARLDHLTEWPKRLKAVTRLLGGLTIPSVIVFVGLTRDDSDAVSRHKAVLPAERSNPRGLLVFTMYSHPTALSLAYLPICNAPVGLPLGPFR